MSAESELMSDDAVSDRATRFRSVGRRFSYALTFTVTLLLVAFAIVAIFTNIRNIQDQLEAKMDNALNLAGVSLRIPLWNVDDDSVNDFLEALFLDPTIVYAQVVADEQDKATRVRQDYPDMAFSDFADSTQFLVKTADIYFEETLVGTLRLAIPHIGGSPVVLSHEPQIAHRLGQRWHRREPKRQQETIPTIGWIAFAAFSMNPLPGYCCHFFTISSKTPFFVMSLLPASNSSRMAMVFGLSLAPTAYSALKSNAGSFL